jgi:hypothetical protein
MTRNKLSSIFRERYLPLGMVRLIDSMRHLAGILNRYPLADRAKSLSCQPLFIVSAGRSGTTLLRSMLVVGGQIAIPPESQVIPRAVRKYRSLQHVGWADLSSLIVALFEGHANFSQWETDLSPVYQTVIHLAERERSFARVIDQVFRCYADQHFPRASTWGDQSPINTLYLPWIFRTFPDARYLHLLRDGRDAIASMVVKGQSVEPATARWANAVEQVSKLQPQLEPDRFLQVRYEDLVLETTEILQQVCAFLGIEYTDRMLDFWQSPTTIEHKYHEHHRNLARPVFADSINTWAERLSTSEQEYVLSRVGDLLKRFGYRD